MKKIKLVKIEESHKTGTFFKNVKLRIDEWTYWVSKEHKKRREKKKKNKREWKLRWSGKDEWKLKGGGKT